MNKYNAIMINIKKSSLSLSQIMKVSNKMDNSRKI